MYSINRKRLYVIPTCWQRKKEIKLLEALRIEKTPDSAEPMAVPVDLENKAIFKRTSDYI